MNSIREEKLSRSTLVDFLWRSEKRIDGVYVAKGEPRSGQILDFNSEEICYLSLVFISPYALTH
jgi:hypothetical protein